MPGQRQGCWSWKLLVIFSLLGLTEEFEAKEDEWEELGSDIAALHRLQGLSEHMFDESFMNTSTTRGNDYHQSRFGRSVKRLDTEENPLTLLDGFQDCENVTAHVITKEKDFNAFLVHIEKQKVQDWLLGASEISHSYNQKLLIMTDTEKSTSDRVQQEYSKDPHYSVKVTKDCLFNDSCVPAADRYTVVKIFGSVSEDGQTVSGLDGSSLAKLMLKPSLEAAPVLSLDGNTTTQFHQNFIRVFMLRGLQTVLETNQNNQQIYQVMDRPDSVSSYKIPQRPADHTTQYDHQQIVMMENDPVVRRAAEYLYDKHPAVSSVYVLDENQRPKLIHGEPVSLSEDSRLVLVGHGKRNNTGEMRLSGHSSGDVAQIIERTNRGSDKIKTTSVVACEVGSDQRFMETLLRDLHENNIKTELHVRDTLIQVTHTGKKITQEISPEGLQWRHKDNSKKVVAIIDRNGDLIMRNEPGSKGEAVFTNERNFLGGGENKGIKKPAKNFIREDSWPDEPKSFVNPEVFKKIDQNKVKMKSAIDELEALSWGIFHSDQPAPKKISVNNPGEIRDYEIGKREKKVITWIDKEGDKRQVLNECYEIKSGEDVKNIIRHYAKNGEEKTTYLKINDWIYEVDPRNLYVYPVGKKLDNNNVIEDIKTCIDEQAGNERYPDMRDKIFRNVKNEEEKNQQKQRYAEYVENTFLGEHPDVFKGSLTGYKRLSMEAWFTTYFTATVISESARNFRTFSLTLMALDMVQSKDNNIRQKGLDFFFDNHPMTRGGSWIDPSRRGFAGSATHEDSSKLTNHQEEFRKTEKQLMGDLVELVKREGNFFTEWKKTVGNGESDVVKRMTELSNTYKTMTDNSDFQKKYNDFKTDTNKSPQPEDHRKPSTSGTLGGYDDGYVTMRDLNSASELENTFKHESYFSRASASLAEDVHAALQHKYGETLAGMHLQEQSARIENGQFVCKLVSERAGAEPVEFRADLSPQSQHYSEKMLENIETSVHEMEQHSSASSHQVNKYVEKAGTAVGTLGLMLGLKGAARAFEEGNIKDGVMGSLQTAHGVTAMTTSAIASKALTSESRIAKAIMRSPAMKRFMTVIPIVGIGFGIYNIEQDLERGDALGYIDAALDFGMVELDVVELAQPELAPFIAPINLALSVVRMAIDDVYMGIQNELNSLPADAGVLDKIAAVFVGFGKGIMHFAIHVASVFYDWRYDEIEEGRRLVAQISDYHQYYKVTKQQDGTTAIDFAAGASSWNGGGINFCLADEGQSELCMDYFVSHDESPRRRCWNINTDGSKDIILGLGESHGLEHKTYEKKVLMFIPAGSVTVVSGYEAVSYSRYGTYRGNRDSNRFFAVQKSQDEHMIEVMLSYYYRLHGEPGDDTFFLGPQRSYVEGSGGRDTYIIPENGGKTIINNYDPSRAQDNLHFSVDYRHISVSKSGNDAVLTYEGSHTVRIQNWFLGEDYRHMNMMSGDGVLFEISSTVVSSVQLVARGINKMFKTEGEVVDASQPLLRTVTNIFGSQYDDELIGNGERNLIDGGGGIRDILIGAEGEDIYMVKGRKRSSVLIENYSRDEKTDLAIIEANLHTFRVRVEGDDVHLVAQHGSTLLHVTVVNWFRSSAHRHLLFITKDLITFTVSDNKADCLQRNIFTTCIKSLSIDYSSSPSPLRVDLEKDEALDSVTEIRGSNYNDVIKGNKEHNVVVPGLGDDFIEGRGGEDWYVITAGQGVKTINNLSPDLTMDLLFLKEQYQHITCRCEGQSIIVQVQGRRTVILQNWFKSKNYQHLQIKTSDGITAGLKPSISSCGWDLMLPLTIDYRNLSPELLPVNYDNLCMYFYKKIVYSDQKARIYFDRGNCMHWGKVMIMNDVESVKEMYGSSGFDIMAGNSNDNLLDPHTGGALMIGGEGKDTYIIKHGDENMVIIDNFAEDQKTDTVLVDMDFLDGSRVILYSTVLMEPTRKDVHVRIMKNEERLEFILRNYANGEKHQHLEFQSSDGVHFKLKSLNSSEDDSFYQVEAFKVTLTQSPVDCRLDLSAQRNLSEVHTVQGCPSQSNVIIGNNRDNALIGGWKDDALDGGDGDDTLVGGNGADILIGGRGDDTLYGEDGNDTLMGNSGRDVFLPGPGADLVDGGPGRDSVLYRGDHEKGEGVYVNLLTGQGHHADAEGDVLKDVETVIGTIYSDILVSGYESSLLKGSDGNDILVSTGGDYLVGGDGNDIYMFTFSNGSVTIDNCATDNATDVLYLSSNSSPEFDCQLLSDRVLLTFFGFDQSTVKIALRGWISDDDECGHLVLVFREVEASVDMLLQECQYRKKESLWSSIITRAICITLLVFHLAFALQGSRKLIRKAQKPKRQKEDETNVEAESAPTVM
ncbi:uncharacterized protein LOC102295251 isoform X2 [Haplochromis burtoni]|uniref:uncharacterized protein LOC102295251 isoform X2 n=1 Tax=Haplochromis burtoni TaxID=8153 RepID=UPI001C2D151E|nr:uncharacterized protein LOC102295251 isoform X2 [Haplochromis burtoni]